MVGSIFGVDAGRQVQAVSACTGRERSAITQIADGGRVGRRERSQRRLEKPWARAIVAPSVSWARSCAALDMESIMQIMLPPVPPARALPSCHGGRRGSGGAVADQSEHE